MNISIDLSEHGIEVVASALEQVLRNIEDGIDTTVDVLTREGAEIAQNADGDMATITMTRPDSMTGVIEASGKEAIFAEFGAGDDTMTSIPFENAPPVEVYPGSYSELVGSGKYAREGYWYYRGVKYYGGGEGRVQPRQGLYKAKEHIISRANAVAQGAIHL